MTHANIDVDTIRGFGAEWARFDQAALPESESRAIYQSYFRLFPWRQLPDNAVGVDIGCGSGRWAQHVVRQSEVAHLYCVDPSKAALKSAMRNLVASRKASYVVASADCMGLPDNSLDFGFAIGVLHHTPHPERALRAAVRSLKPGAPFLVYFYYALENRPLWFRAIWRVADVARRGLSRAPRFVTNAAADAVALLIYVPLSRLARAFPGRHIPLEAYAGKSFYTMRTDALDRFGTRLEQRLTRSELVQMMNRSGLERVVTDGPPYWLAVGYKSQEQQARHDMTPNVFHVPGVPATVQTHPINPADAGTLL